MDIRIYNEQLAAPLREELDQMYITYILNDAAYNWIKEWEEPDLIYIAYEGDSWLSVTESFNRTILVGDKPIQVVGISGVLTHPDHRGQGYAPGLIESALADARANWNSSFGLLTCKLSLIPYYQRLGWKQIEATVRFKQGDGTITLDPTKVTAMIYAFDHAIFPAGEINLQAYPW